MIVPDQESIVAGIEIFTADVGTAGLVAFSHHGQETAREQAEAWYPGPASGRSDKGHVISVQTGCGAGESN